jgi:hypothetical protein
LDGAGIEYFAPFVLRIVWHDMAPGALRPRLGANTHCEASS